MNFIEIEKGRLIGSICSIRIVAIEFLKKLKLFRPHRMPTVQRLLLPMFRGLYVCVCLCVTLCVAVRMSVC